MVFAAACLWSLAALSFLEPATPEPIDGNWADWSLYSSECSQTCGGGHRTRTRSCTNPVPQDGGAECVGESEQKEPCNEDACPDPNAEWGIWSACSVPCGVGNRTRQFMCSNGTEPCRGLGAKTENETCNTYNKTDCGDLCNRPENMKKDFCPEKAKCKDVSNVTHAKVMCECVMGYKMKGRKCHRPKPAPPTPRPIPTLSPAEKKVVVVITTTASTVLLIFVGLTLIIFLVMRIFTPDRVIQMNMEVSLEAAHLLLLIPAEVALEHPMFCRGISMALHFLFTACFTFMCLEALHMYSLVAYVVQRNGLYSRLVNICIGWSFAILVLVFGICFHFEDYGGKYHCWLQMDSSLIYYQLVPILIMVLLTFMLTEAAGAADYKPLEKADEKQRFSARLSQRANLVIMPLVFTSWLLGTLSTYEQNLGLFSSFSVVNSVLGGAIFAFHTLNNSEVRKKLKQLVTCSCRNKNKNG